MSVSYYYYYIVHMRLIIRTDPELNQSSFKLMNQPTIDASHTESVQESVVLTQLLHDPVR